MARPRATGVDQSGLPLSAATPVATRSQIFVRGSIHSNVGTSSKQQDIRGDALRGGDLILICLGKSVIRTKTWASKTKHSFCAEKGRPNRVATAKSGDSYPDPDKEIIHGYALVSH